MTHERRDAFEARSARYPDDVGSRPALATLVICYLIYLSHVRSEDFKMGQAMNQKLSHRAFIDGLSPMKHMLFEARNRFDQRLSTWLTRAFCSPRPLSNVPPIH